jgi:hypothetical protein
MVTQISFIMLSISQNHVDESSHLGITWYKVYSCRYGAYLVSGIIIPCNLSATYRLSVMHRCLLPDLLGQKNEIWLLSYVRSLALYSVYCII